MVKGCYRLDTIKAKACLGGDESKQTHPVKKHLTRLSWNSRRWDGREGMLPPAGQQEMGWKRDYAAPSRALP